MQRATERFVSQSAQAGTEGGDGGLIRLLSQRFGDGSVYLAREGDRRLLMQAMAIGLVSSDGHVTAAGNQLLKRSDCDGL